MKFTWDAYKGLIHLLKAEGYTFTDYKSYKELGDKSCVILRHDIDSSIKKAYEMALLEKELDVCSTYFVLVSSEFYNPSAVVNVNMLQEMHQMGHGIGLHFDEVKYAGKTEEEVKVAAEQERVILQSILNVPITTISMHRPSKTTLDGDWKFDHMINSYGTEFFRNFKYVSDSRMHWREDVEEIIRTE